MSRRYKSITLSPSILACTMAYLAALVLAFADARLCAIPLALFVLLCLAAPFFPGFSFYLSIVSRGSSGIKAVALTFDDGPDPTTTPALLGLLKRCGTCATFFVTGRRASEHRGLVRQILSDGHSIGNHSYNHSPLLMLRSYSHLLHDIQATQALLTGFGITPLVFRPPVGITSPRLGPALAETGLLCVNFSCRGYDAGNRRIRRLAYKIVKKAKPGDIILLHDSAPNENFNLNEYLAEIESILAGMKKKGLQIVPLSEIIGMPVMKTRP